MKRSFVFLFLLIGLSAAVVVRASAQNNAPAPAPVSAAAPAPAAASSLPSAVPAPAAAEPAPEANQMDIGEGYAHPSLVELVKTMVMMNGYDTEDSSWIDEYGRVVYCNLYYENYKNDVVWNRIRDQILSRVRKKREYYRVNYEVVSPFVLGRYDFKTQFFPIVSQSTLLKNVGYINLRAASDTEEECRGRFINTSFPTSIDLQLPKPLTVEGIYMPVNKVEKMMVRMEESGNSQRTIYGRIRVHVNEVPPLPSFKSREWQVVLKGEVRSVDFFLDNELTKPIGSANLP